MCCQKVQTQRKISSAKNLCLPSSCGYRQSPQPGQCVAALNQAQRLSGNRGPVPYFVPHLDQYQWLPVIECGPRNLSYRDGKST